MKKTTAAIALILLLVIFPFLGSDAFADFVGSGSLPLHVFSEPLVMLLFGATLVGFGSGLRKIK
ncbi:hypothetical protein DESC_730081 [Desulfosarcina cetonica]|uniref:hypothetical protein n=1 Tax=Desulfosarcina cetonica TaxID=90730 RepID=UPI0006D24201|nr:hypothetical protein [Desulfosarcina cetonica]VTR69202.1 hypothetical protein DESC_730081 [Desulfosarcina cetonica]